MFIPASELRENRALAPARGRTASIPHGTGHNAFASMHSRAGVDARQTRVGDTTAMGSRTILLGVAMSTVLFYGCPSPNYGDAAADRPPIQEQVVDVDHSGTAI